MDISVIIPTFNRREKVLEAINSVLLQEPKNFEIIVVDDGSTDQTFEYFTDNKLPIKLLRQNNRGSASARNLGINNAVGDFVAFLDSDDLWLENKLKLQLDYLKSHQEIPLVYTDEYLEINGKIEDKTRFQRNPPKNKLLFPAFVDLCPIHTSSVMVRKDVLFKVGPFNEELKIHEDSDLWNRVSEDGDFGFINKPLVVYRWSGDANHLMSKEKKELFINEGRKYLQLFEQRWQKRGMTPEIKEAIEISYEKMVE